MMEQIDAGRYVVPPDGQPNQYVEHLRTAALSVGTYVVPADGNDDQSPHTEDEVYVVTAGRGRLVCDSGTVAVGPGSVVYVPAGEGHRFVVEEDLAAVVLFAPPEGSQASL